MAVKFTNNARTTLAADISNSATTATVTSGSVFPVLNAGEYFYCTFDNGTNNEIVKVTARSGNTLTIVRGVDNTTARAFSTDDAAELRATAGLLTDIQENIAAKSANQTVYNATTASSATDYDIGIDPGLESNAMVFLNGVMQHHDTFSFSGSTLTFDTAPSNGLALEVIVDNLINLQSSNLTVDTFTAADVGGNPQVDFVLSDAPAGETNLIVFVDGVFQANDTYTISSTTLSMTDGVTADMVVTVYVMNPVNIGAPSDNTVTSSKLSGNITMPADLTVTGDVAFDSPTFVVDNANSRVGLGTATPSVPVDIVGEVKISSHLNMPDNAIAKFGTGSDLQIYHDGNNSFIDETGTGNLYVKSNSIMHLMSDDIRLMNAANSETILKGVVNGAVTLYHDNSAKLATTSTGIDVTGTATMDGLTVNSGGANVVASFTSTDGTGAIQLADNAGNVELAAVGNDFHIQNAGSAAKMVVLNSGNVGIGTSSPSQKLHVSGNVVVGANIILDANDSYVGFPSNGIYYNNSADHISVKTAATERMRIDSSGQVKIHTPITNDFFGLSLQYNSGDTADFKVNQATGQIKIGGSATGYYPTFWSNNTERMRIDTSGNVDITTGNLFTDTTSGIFFSGGIGSFTNGIYGVGVNNVAIAAGGGERFRITSAGQMTQTGAANTSIGFTIKATATNDYVSVLQFNDNSGVRSSVMSDHYNNALIFKHNSNVERMRLDSSGNLLVGTTSAYSSSGVTLSNDGVVYSKRSGGIGLYVDRETNDGALAEFRKDGSTVGSIGVTNGSQLYIGSNDTALWFSNGFNQIIPYDTTTGAGRDNAIDLGRSSIRFDDIYATNGTIQTSDRNEKQDIEALTDAETRVAVAAKGLLRKFRWQSAVEEKGDNARIHFGIIAQDLQDAFTAEGLDAGDYAMFISDTWTDDDGVEQTRLGVRYSELLAFIIAAI